MACPPGSGGILSRIQVQTIPGVVYPDDMLDPVDFIPQSPERRDLLGEDPCPPGLAPPLIPPPVSRAYLQLMLPETPPPPRPPVPEFPSFGFVDGLEDVSRCEVTEENSSLLEFEQLEREMEQREEMNRNFSNLARDPGEGFSCSGGGSMLVDDSIPERSFTGSNLTEYLANKTPGSFMIALREHVRDPAERFRRLQHHREQRFPPPMSTPIRIEDEEIEFPQAIFTPSPITQQAMINAERRFNEIMDDSRNYYAQHPSPPNLDLVRRNLFEGYEDTPPNLDLVRRNLFDGYEDSDPCPPRIPTPPRPPPTTEEVRAAARARMEAICCGQPTLPPRPAQGPENSGLEVLIRPEETERLRRAAMIRAHFICYPTRPIPADACGVEDISSMELRDDSIPRGPHERYSLNAPRAPCPETRANRSLPRSHAYRPIDAVHMREDPLLDESCNFVDRSLNLSEEGYVNQSLPPRTQIFPGEGRRSFGTTPPRAVPRRRSLPVIHIEEQVDPCPPEFMGTIGPLVFPEFPSDNRSMIDDACIDFDNVLDISEAAGGTDTVQVQGPNKSPWKIQIKLMAPTASTSGLRPPSRMRAPCPDGARPGPSGLRPRASGTSGLRVPSAVCPPGSSTPDPGPQIIPVQTCPPAPCPSRPTGLRPPSSIRPPAPMVRSTSQANFRQPSQAGRGASQTNLCPPSQGSMRPPGGGAIRRPSQTRPPRAPPGTRGLNASQGAIPRTTGRLCPPPGTGNQDPAQAASQSRLARPSTRRC